MNLRPCSGAGKAAYSREDSGGNGPGGRVSDAEAAPGEHSGGSKRSDSGIRAESAPRNEAPFPPDAQTPEDAQWEELLFDERLPDDFTERFMAGLEGVEVEPAEEEEVPEADRVSGADQAVRPQSDDSAAAASDGIRQTPTADIHASSTAEKSKRARRRKRTIRQRHGRIWLVSALVLLLAGGALIYTQPTIADRVRSLFAADGYADPGMREAKEKGFLDESEAESSSSGYTIKAQEVIADSTRMIVGFTFYDKHGKTVPGRLGFGTEYRISDELGSLAFSNGIAGDPSIDRHEFIFNRPAVGDKLFLNINIYQIEPNPNKISANGTSEKVDGLWGFSIETDLTKAAEASLVTPIDESYETPSGIRIQMLGATKTPSGGSLEFETSLTEEAQRRAAGGAGAEHEVVYRIEKADGEPLTDNLSFAYDASSAFNRWNGITNWFYAFNNFPYDRESLRFVLEGYVIREKSDASVTFDPASLSAKNPAVFKDSGDEFRFNSLTIGPNPNMVGGPNPPLTVGILQFGGTYGNPNFPQDTWIAQDEKGREYSIEFQGAVDLHGSKLNGDQTFLIKGLEKMPAKLTLKRTVVRHMYRDGEWSFLLPQTGTPGVLPE
ncbi:DUF4179 domain-containing protein [Saccharibacillus sp. CPCC 101409]|uniref:DUF4179 domain-containing protein n=1 Tax=Saccharibacillus sp. CPCC 101409 TaxID=3058041 RepID=UPI002672CC03|nr:DUF4179 domain-containing protein [Saccharibacillus sp. CPCC 101409]MDO3408470.1 DUF4179 domain-containing protein [Saccharibacillus sp. CPCC 101409]